MSKYITIEANNKKELDDKIEYIKERYNIIKIARFDGKQHREDKKTIKYVGAMITYE